MDDQARRKKERLRAGRWRDKQRSAGLVPVLVWVHGTRRADIRAIAMRMHGPAPRE